jgi:2-hydroxychromene-2-carboxylate isomerase
VSSWRVDGELFWGSERLDRVGERVAGALKTRAPK